MSDSALVTVIGLIAAALTTAAYVPQVVKAWRTRATKDISLTMFLVMTLATALWLVYGFAIGDLPVILANSVILVQVCTILVLKLRNG